MLITCSLLLCSCCDNIIYFDLKSQSIKSCNKQIICNIYISNLKNEDYYHFTKIPKKKGTNEFNIVNINQEYTLEGLYKELPLDSFKLRPNTEYEVVNHTFGDAADGKLRIKTNNKGSVFYASKTYCE